MLSLSSSSPPEKDFPVAVGVGGAWASKKGSFACAWRIFSIRMCSSPSEEELSPPPSRPGLGKFAALKFFPHLARSFEFRCLHDERASSRRAVVGVSPSSEEGPCGSQSPSGKPVVGVLPSQAEAGTQQVGDFSSSPSPSCAVE